ncbi:MULTISPECIES: flagellar brake protein [Aneurinibacillus]|uniref:Glycosyltransferase-like protein n=1 Tax=Aneurinibacillus danicus TaxID=267746 RepID=A0A511VBM6_9BACL|nr:MULTISPECIES: flagellar brake domain-containing protein [Aneurinibacillus]GEN36327.1 glycosyltransferase-like protein [Aneurinibacillus danicus]
MFPLVNQTVQLVSYNERNEEKKYKAVVADITEEFIMITYPIDEQSGRTSLLMEGSTLYVTYSHSNGAQYEFMTVVVRRQRENIPMLVLIKPALDNIRKIQRRDYVRVPAKVKIECLWKEGEEDRMYSGLTVDISAGGAKFICNANIKWPEERRFECRLYLPEMNAGNKQGKQELCIPLKVRIVRHPVINGNGTQTVAIVYEDIAEVHREKIIRYCFARQLEIKNKLM